MCCSAAVGLWYLYDKKKTVKKKGNMHIKVEGYTQHMLGLKYVFHIEIEMKVKIQS